MNRVAVVLALLVAPACVAIPVAGTGSIPVRPGGEIVNLDLGGRVSDRVVAELLAVRPEGLVLYTGAVVEARWEGIRSASFEHVRGEPDRWGRIRPIDWPYRAKPDPSTLEQLRLLSRFPQGLDEDLTRRLLDAYGRESIRPCQSDGRVDGEVDCGN